MIRSKVFESTKLLFDHLIKDDGFHRIFDKVTLVSAGNGKCSAEMVVEKAHCNIHGTLHGGFITSAVDFFSSLGLLTHPKNSDNIDLKLKPCVSIDIHVSFIEPGKIGEKVIIKAETIKFGRNLVYLEVILSKKTDNKVIAKGSHTLYFIQSKI